MKECLQTGFLVVWESDELLQPEKNWENSNQTLGFPRPDQIDLRKFKGAALASRIESLSPLALRQITWCYFKQPGPSDEPHQDWA